MKRNKSFFVNAIQRMGVIALIVLVAISSISFTSEKVLVLSGDKSECDIRNYLPSGELVLIPKDCTREVRGIDSCITIVHLWGTGCTTHTDHSEKRTKICFKPSYFKRQEKIALALLPVVGLKQRRIAMIEMKYPYGKSQIYMGGSSVSTMARFLQMGYQVDHINLNTEQLDDPLIRDKIENADFYAVSVIGAPYIPNVISLARDLSKNQKPFLVGGQVIERLTAEQFQTLFTGTSAKQVVSNLDIALALNIPVNEIGDAYSISYIPALQNFGDVKLKAYLSNEMALVLSQGCHFQCAFCAASKAQREKFKVMNCFSEDLRFLARKAKDFNISEVQFYATSLDFFQNPKIVASYLEEVASIQEETGVKFKIRCLCCVSSFLNASKVLGESYLKLLIERSGLWCLGFGVDGADPEVWKAQKKRQNNLNEIKDGLDLAKQMNVRSEILLVMGFPQDNFRTLAKCVINSIRYVSHWPNIMLRPYLAKEFVPGNDGWKSGKPAIDTFISDPKKFYNLDFCAIGSKSTHPRFWHRAWSNISYLTIIGLFTPLGKCVTSPLLPQGNTGLYGSIAKLFNRIVPMDR